MIQIKKHNFDNTWVELRPSTVCDGVGVFAIKDIPPDTRIFEHAPRDKFYYWSEVSDPAVVELISRLCNNNKQGFWISGHPTALGMGYYVNHSESPNVIHNRDLDDYITLVDIKAGEELVCIYEKEEIDWLF